MVPPRAGKAQNAPQRTAADGVTTAMIEQIPVAPLTPPLVPHVILLFGATGDLAARKLLPGLLHLAQSGMLPEYRIIGVARSELSDEEFRNLARHACDQYATGKISLLQWAGFEKKLSFVSQTAGPEALAAAVARAEESIGGEVRRLHYLSIPPAAAAESIE